MESQCSNMSAYTLLRTRQRVINMCMGLEGVLAALNTPINHATCVHGNQLCYVKLVINDRFRK